MDELVAGLDGSDDSRGALRWAAATAAAARVTVRTVQAWVHPRSAVLPIAPVPVSPPEMDDQTRDAITALVTAVVGPSADDSGGLRSMGLGSTANHLVRHRGTNLAVVP
jgi:hypothetical protein